MFRVPARLALTALLLLVSPAWANFSSISSDSFSYCYFEAENVDGENCVISEYVPGGDCGGGCIVPGSYGHVTGELAWEVSGEGETILGDVGYWAAVTVDGVRMSADMFMVSGACAYADPQFAGPPEVALFRFDGDPSVFDGTSVVSVSEFVTLGLIDASDVLLVHDCATQGQFDLEVDVAGIPDEELVVFSGGRVVPGNVPDSPVPAVSLLGTVVLALLLFGLGAFTLRGRI